MMMKKINMKGVATQNAKKQNLKRNEEITKAEYKEEVKNLEEQVESLSLEEAQSQGEIRNILLIGSTGNGKSTLGNVLVNKNGNFEEVFKESAGSISQTKGISEEVFEVPLTPDGREKITYRI